MLFVLDEILRIENFKELRDRKYESLLLKQCVGRSYRHIDLFIGKGSREVARKEITGEEHATAGCEEKMGGIKLEETRINPRGD